MPSARFVEAGNVERHGDSGDGTFRRHRVDVSVGIAVELVAIHGRLAHAVAPRYQARVERQHDRSADDRPVARSRRSVDDPGAHVQVELDPVALVPCPLDRSIGSRNQIAVVGGAVDSQRGPFAPLRDAQAERESLAFRQADGYPYAAVGRVDRLHIDFQRLPVRRGDLGLQRGIQVQRYAVRAGHGGP